MIEYWTIVLAQSLSTNTILFRTRTILPPMMQILQKNIDNDGDEEEGGG